MSEQLGMRFTATLQEMAESEILGMVPPATLKRMRDKERHPLVKAFVVGHEGEARGNMIGIGNVVKRWFKTMIHALGAKISSGLQLFHGHAAGTNEHEGRSPVGEVVGKAVKQIDGRESVVVACHIFEPFKHLPLDVASVEMDVQYMKNKDGSVDICDIGSVTGIALGNSQIERPGFPGATLLGQLQAFEESHRITTGHKPALVLGFKAINTIRLGRPEEEV